MNPTRWSKATASPTATYHPILIIETLKKTQTVSQARFSGNKSSPPVSESSATDGTLAWNATHTSLDKVVSTSMSTFHFTNDTIQPLIPEKSIGAPISLRRRT